jgi:hypothetical protein
LKGESAAVAAESRRILPEISHIRDSPILRNRGRSVKSVQSVKSVRPGLVFKGNPQL